MITFFTTAKSFLGEARVRQMNAIMSWKALHPDIDVLLFGSGEGYEAAARELGIVHIPEVEVNEKGVPRVDSMFSLASQRGRHPYQAYVNCDIILFDDFIKAVERIRFKQFLMVAQRWDVDIPSMVTFADDGWQRDIRNLVRDKGVLQYPGAIDFFLSRGEIWHNLPPMVVGRGLYDHWLIYYCRQRGVSVVDASRVVTIVHQNHDYSHIAGGHKVVEGGEEALRNLELGGGWEKMFTIQDADWLLADMGVFKNWCRNDSERCAQVFATIHPMSFWSRTKSGRLFLEAIYEWVIRCQKFRQGQIGPLLKWVPWLIKRMRRRSFI